MGRYFLRRVLAARSRRCSSSSRSRSSSSGSRRAARSRASARCRPKCCATSRRSTASTGRCSRSTAPTSRTWRGSISGCRPSIRRCRCHEIIGLGFPVTLQLAAVALVWALLIGVNAGIIGALRQNTAWDHGAMAIAMIGISLPTFVLGPLLILRLRADALPLPAGAVGHLAAHHPARASRWARSTPPTSRA